MSEKHMGIHRPKKVDKPVEKPKAKKAEEPKVEDDSKQVKDND